MWSFTISSWLSNLVLLFIFHNQLSENHKVTQTKYSTIVSAATQWMWRRHRGQESQLLTCQRCFTLLRLVKYGPSNMVLQVQLSSPVPKAMKTLEFIKGKAVVLNLKYIFTAISSYHGPPQSTAGCRMMSSPMDGSDSLRPSQQHVEKPCSLPPGITWQPLFSPCNMAT